VGGSGSSNTARGDGDGVPRQTSPRKNPTNNANMKKNWHQLDVDDGGGGMSEQLPWTTDKYTPINWQRRGISQ